MKSAQHHIRKQFLDFDFTTKSAALQWQQKVAFQYQQEYVKKIEAVLDKYEDGSCIEIDKIVIDIGTVKEDEVALRIGEELDLVLKKLRRTETIQQEIPTQKSISETSKEVITRTKKEELLQAFLYFISQGHFPWHIKINAVSVLEEQLLQQFSVKDLMTSLKGVNVLDEPWQKSRFFYQFSESFVQEIARLYFKNSYSSLTHIAEFCEAEFEKPFFESHFASNAKSRIPNDISRWILLFAPENRIFWSREFVKWYLTKNYLSKRLITNEKVWTALAAVTSEDSDKVTEGYLIQLFAALTTHFKAQTLRLDASQEKENKIAAESDTQGNITYTSDGKGGLETEAGRIKNEKKDLKTEAVEIKDEKQLFNDEKSEAETAQILSNEEKSPDTQSLDNAAVLKEHPKSGDLEKELPLTDELAKTVSINKDSKPPTTEPNKEPKEETTNIEKASVGSDADEAENKEELKNEVTEANQPTQSDSTFSANTSFEDSDFESILNKVKRADFYPTVEETIDALLPPEKDFSKVEQNTSVLPPDSYYLIDSGIVLVWPYLSRLFENLDYTAEHQFVSREQQERAVMLLGYIASGKPTCEEHELVFSKFLCNWPFQMPVIHPFELTKKEQEEVKSMLTGLIAHWSILKNTSIEGLRETFFWREGKLEEKEDFWKLVVEQKGTDILLNHLPYGIAMIKLPWHKKMLRVDWA